MDILIGVGIVLIAIAVWCLIMYWPIKSLYNMLKPKIDNITEQKEKIESLEKRIVLLEKKLNNQ